MLIITIKLDISPDRGN